MKKIILLIILMLGIGFISCTSDNTEIKEDSEILLKDLPVYENSWYTFEVKNGQMQIFVHGEKAEQLINISKGNCSTCKVNCSTQREIGENNYIVACDNGRTYHTFKCGNDWFVRDVTYELHQGQIIVSFAC